MYIVDNQRCYKYYNYYKKKCVYRLKKKFFPSVSERANGYIYLCSMNIDIEQWISDPQRDYKAGVKMLEMATNNSQLVRVFSNRSPRFAMGDLVAELRKVGGRLKNYDVKEKPSAVPAVPPVVESAKQMIHDTWVRLSKIHRSMFETGESNEDASVKKRLELMKEREPLIERYNSIYEAKEEYFAGRVSEEQLKEVMEGKTLDQVLHPETPKVETPMQQMSDLQLAKKAKAAKAAINRAKNQLRYQQDTAAKKENPMPQCPKRKEIEKKLTAKQDELAKLESELKRRGC